MNTITEIANPITTVRAYEADLSIGESLEHIAARALRLTKSSSLGQ